MLNILLPCLLFAQSLAGESPPEAPRPFVLAHYMPWYESEGVSGRWGWHWTMNHFVPPESFAAHDPPLAGLYDSGDLHLIEYHAALMKLSGLDGVIFDWYGVSGFRDYAMIHKNVTAMIPVLRRAGLRYAICYEDQSVKHRAAEMDLSREEAVQQGHADFAWLAAEAFTDPAYVRLDGRPVLLVFGPQFFEAGEWAALLDPIEPRPIAFGLPHLVESTGMDGAFGWPPVTGGVEITPGEWRSYLDDLHARTAPVISVVFPGFRDIYEQAGLHPSYGSIDPRDGATFTETWERAWQSGAPIIQVATWNDFGEGTVVEPTRDQEYSHLQSIRGALQPQTPPDALHLPLMVYTMRKEHAANEELLAELQRVSDALLAGEHEQATAILDALAENPIQSTSPD